MGSNRTAEVRGSIPLSSTTTPQSPRIVRHQPCRCALSRDMPDDPIPAATLVIFRDRPDAPPELLMVERAKAMAFAGGAMVFPGGRIDPGDHILAQASGAGEDGAARIDAKLRKLRNAAHRCGSGMRALMSRRSRHGWRCRGSLIGRTALADFARLSGA